jgi:hypothetical protein
MNKDDIKENEYANIEFMKMSMEMELILEHFEPVFEEDDYDDSFFYTSSEIVLKINEKLQSKLSLSPVNVGRALSALKFVRVSRRSINEKSNVPVYGYLAKERN